MCIGCAPSVSSFRRSCLFAKNHMDFNLRHVCLGRLKEINLYGLYFPIIARLGRKIRQFKMKGMAYLNVGNWRVCGDCGANALSIAARVKMILVPHALALPMISTHQLGDALSAELHPHPGYGSTARAVCNSACSGCHNKSVPCAAG